ncbi:APC family permease [Glaciihabitans sp. INWT7]|uniref:APC family permease n=1 Tax=Glaciihabitans sp. INWT7 TaxID=2596912 RepID=UPI001629BA99|nr:APC family permease [Glaciihabitans sp. INWT7]QNE46523.1 APC family permease [Glaciihabitans sp. INWT7]
MTDAPPVQLPVSETPVPKLRRNLSIWEAIGVSVALMAPSMAININPQGTIGLVGRAVPLTFAIATVAVLLIAYTFVRLSQRFHHSGSVYGFVGATLGARAGAFSGWAMAGTYIFYGAVTSMAAGIFLTSEIRALGIWKQAPDWLGFVIGAVLLGLVWFLASRPAKGGTRLLLIVESVTVALILIVTVVIIVKLLVGDVPAAQTFDLSVFTIQPGSDPSSVFLGVVFAFLSFAGFEAAATLGEEARNPRKDIPRAILGTAIFGGVYFIVVTAVEVMGFGTDEKGIKAFAASGSLLGDLGATYIAPWIGTVITLGASISAVACALACVVGASRLIYALSRDGLGPVPFKAVSAKHGVPSRAVGAVIVTIYVFIAVAWFVLQVKPFDLFVTSGTTGTLILLVAYVLATIGAVKLLFFSGDKRVKTWEIVIPVLALIVLGYTLFRNIFPFPVGAAWWGPGLSIAWLVIFLVIVIARPAAARRAGELLTKAEGLSKDPVFEVETP